MIKKFLLFFLLIPYFAFASEKIDINNSSLQQLDELVGIGPKYAQAIIDARPFASLDELDKVKGIGPKTLQKIKDQGLACVNCVASNQATGVQANLTTQNYSTGIIISEILPNPDGPDETKEYIKIYNTNNSDIDISGWKIEDSSGITNTYIIPKETIIGSQKTITFSRTETKIMLNNEGDKVLLLYPDKTLANAVSFVKAPLGQTYIKTSSGWKWLGATSSNKTLPKTENSVNNNIVEAGFADLSHITDLNQDINRNNNPWFLFYIALIITIFSALLILFIKFKLNNHVRT